MESIGPGVRKTPEHVRIIAYRSRISVATIESGKARRAPKGDPGLHSDLTGMDRAADVLMESR